MSGTRGPSARLSSTSCAIPTGTASTIRGRSVSAATGPAAWGCAESPTKHFRASRIEPFFRLATAKRPAEELYDLARDPAQVENVAGSAAYRDAQQRLRAELDHWLRETGDPRATVDDDRSDRFPYYGAGEVAIILVQWHRTAALHGEEPSDLRMPQLCEED
jgi:hypothetical protein